jgi:hypothetical protein
VGIPLVDTTFTVDPPNSFKKYFQEKKALSNIDWPGKIQQIYFSMEADNFALHKMEPPGKSSKEWKIKIPLLTGGRHHYRYAIKYTKESNSYEVVIDEAGSFVIDKNRGFYFNYFENA